MLTLPRMSGETLQIVAKNKQTNKSVRRGTFTFHSNLNYFGRHFQIYAMGCQERQECAAPTVPGLGSPAGHNTSEQICRFSF